MVSPVEDLDSDKAKLESQVAPQVDFPLGSRAKRSSTLAFPRVRPTQPDMPGIIHDQLTPIALRTQLRSHRANRAAQNRTACHWELAAR